MREYWLQQAAGQALFPDLLWSRPQNKRQAGKLLIVGGNSQGFAAAAQAYTEAEQAGIGTARVLLPDSLQKSIGQVFEAGEYAPSTPSGSFSRASLSELLDLAEWADGALLAGDFGRNSETAVLFEQFIDKYHDQLTLTQDAIDYFLPAPEKLLNRPATLLVLEFARLQKLSTAVRFSTAFTSSMDFLHIVDTLHEFTTQYPINLVLRHSDTIFCAVQGQVSTTRISESASAADLAAHAAVWWLQNPGKPLEALTSAGYLVSGTAGRT